MIQWLCFAGGTVVIYLPMQETQETWIQSLSWEDPMDKEITTHSSILAWKIPWRGEPGGLLSMGSHKNWSQLND